jgi:hypothetical protein
MGRLVDHVGLLERQREALRQRIAIAPKGDRRASLEQMLGGIEAQIRNLRTIGATAVATRIA